MPRRFFRKFAPKRQSFHGHWYLAPFDHLLHDGRLWGVRRRTIVPAFALGLFIAYLPAPGHMLLAALGALFLRINLPVAVLTVWVSNPLTMGPMFYFAYWLGRQLLGLPGQPFDFEPTLAWLQNSFSATWQPLMLGCVLLGALLSLAGYVALDLLWRASIADYLERRRARREAAGKMRRGN